MGSLSFIFRLTSQKRTWLDVIKRDPTEVKRDEAICSLHFPAEAYTKLAYYQSTILKKDAVPVLTDQVRGEGLVSKTDITLKNEILQMITTG